MKDDLAPVILKSDAVYDESLSAFPININQPKSIAFVDAVYANNQQKRQCTIGYIFVYCGGTIVYSSKTQYITTISSTGAEFLVAVSCAKITFYMNLVLNATSQLLSIL